MNYMGDYSEDSVVIIKFTTNDSAGGAVAPSTAFEDSDFKIYKNGSPAEKTSQNGITVASPFDGITGLHQVTIDTSVDTGDAGFWEPGADYSVVLNPNVETVDGQTVVHEIATFSIENRFHPVPGDATLANQTELLNRLTAARAGYLDNLNVGGPVATGADVTSIQNNTRFVASLPSQVIIPSSGDLLYKITAYFYDTEGGMEDPDNNEFAVQIRAVQAQANKTAFFDDENGATASTASTTFTPDYFKMVREGAGIYAVYYKLPSSELPDQWIADFACMENGSELHYTRTATLFAETPGTAVLEDSSVNHSVIARAVRGFDSSSIGLASGAIERRLLDENLNALNAYDPPTRSEATSDMNNIVTNVVINRNDIGSVKAKTDLLEFSGGDVKATLDGETVDANLIQIEGSPQVDGLDITEMFKNIISALQGEVDRSGNTYTFKDQGGVSTFTYTVNTDGRTVPTS